MPANPLVTPSGPSNIPSMPAPAPPPRGAPPRSRYRPRSSLAHEFSSVVEGRGSGSGSGSGSGGGAGSGAGLLGLAKAMGDEMEGDASYASARGDISSHQSLLADLAAEQGNSGLSSVSPRMTGLPHRSLGEPAPKRRRMRLSSLSNGNGNGSSASMSMSTASGSPLGSLGRRAGGGRGTDLLQGLMRSAAQRERERDLPLGGDVLGSGSGGGMVIEDALEEAMREEDEEQELDPTWAMIARMRTWRHDAILQHLYETAAFWGDKIFAWTGDPNDAFWLAQTHFLTQQYLRAEQILTGHLPPSRMPDLAAANEQAAARKGKAAVTGKGKGKGKAVQAGAERLSPPVRGLGGGLLDDAEDTSMLSEMAELGGVWGVLRGEGRVRAGGQAADDEAGGVLGEGTRLVDWSVACRYLAAQCMIHQEKLTEALELLGSSNVFSVTGRNGTKVPSKNGDLKLEASICRLRAILHLRLSSLALAKESFMEALALDVRNFDAFKELVDGGMMTPEEEWEFVANLCYNDQLAEDDAAFVRVMYQSRLNKHGHREEIATARRLLESVYCLSENADVMVAMADELYAQYKWEECYAVTTRIIEQVPGHATALPLHLACMAQIPRLSSSLFMLAHQLVGQDPDSALTWYAVGLWYFCGQRWSEARRYFSKTSLMDSRFGPAWITFAHSFAYEGEHEQAVTAYSTSARLFPGSHYPHLFIGMEYLQLSNYTLAEESFQAARALFADDPLLLNELGVTHYNKGEFEEAISVFELALSGATAMQGVARIWAGTHCNLGHALRQLGRYEEARAAYHRCIRLDTLNVCALTSLGLIEHRLGEIRRSIDHYHEALAVAPQDPVATVLLELALTAQIELGALSFPGLPPPLVDPEMDPFTDPRGNRLLKARSKPDETGESSMTESVMEITAEDAGQILEREASVASDMADGSSMDISHD